MKSNTLQDVENKTQRIIGYALRFISLSAMARELGVSRKTLIAWKNGRRQMTLHNYFLLENWFKRTKARFPKCR